MLVPLPVQHQIAQKAPLVAYVPARLGIGWHYESGVQFLRLALAGVFDRFPDLQVLLGHWGEVVLFYLDRADWLAMQAELAYRRLVKDWKAAGPSTVGAGATPGRASQRPSSGTAARQGTAPEPAL